MLGRNGIEKGGARTQKNVNRIPTAATENSSTTSSAAKPNVIFTIGKHEKALVA